MRRNHRRDDERNYVELLTYNDKQITQEVSKYLQVKCNFIYTKKYRPGVKAESWQIFFSQLLHGCPCNSWLKKICQDSAFTPADLWQGAVKCGNGATLR